jgi:hypothetical protein
MNSADNRKIKLFLSRDLHSELTRKVIGRNHGDRLFNGDTHRSNIYLPDLYNAIDTGMEEILRLELMQMGIPGLLGGSSNDRKLPSKVQKIASLQAELCREEKELPIRGSDASDLACNSAATSKDETLLSLDLHHNSSFSNGTPTDNWSPYTNFGSNDSCEKELFPSIMTTAREVSSATSSTTSRGSNGRNPLVAKRNSNIDRMLNEVSQQRTSRNHSPKVLAELAAAPSRFTFFIASATPEKNSCVTPPGSGTGGIATTQAIFDADTCASSLLSRSISDHSKRHFHVDKVEKRFVTSFPNRPTQPKSPVNIPAISSMSRNDRVAYHQDITRRLAQNITKFPYSGKV